MSLSLMTDRRKYRFVVQSSRTLFLVFIVALWELLGRNHLIDQLTWSRPMVIAQETYWVLFDETFLLDVRTTAVNIVLGFVFGLVIGLVVGGIASRLRPLVRASVMDWIAAIQAVPFLVFYPVLITIFGLNRLPIVLIVTMVVIIPVTLNAATGMSSIPAAYIRLAKILRMPRLQRLWKIYIPASIPLIFPGIRFGFSLALVSTIGMEFIMASKGLGYRVAAEYHAFAVSEMYAVIVWICLFAIIINSALTRLEARVRKDMVS